MNSAQMSFPPNRQLAKGGLPCFASVLFVSCGRWALTNLAAMACALVDFDGSIWIVEIFPDGGVFPLRTLSTCGVYS